MPLDEQALFNKKPQTRSGKYQCPKCQRTGSYNVLWVLHSKQSKLPPGASRDDREKFDKLRDYLVRLDDHVTCTTCGKKFEIPSQHSMMFAEQFSGLPNEEELEREIAEAAGESEPLPERKPALPARFTRKSSGWK